MAKAKKLQSSPTGAKTQSSSIRIAQLTNKQDKLDKSVKAIIKHLDSQLGPTVNKLNKTVSVVWDNQVGISKSQHNTDDQLAVLTRMVIVAVNKLVARTAAIHTHITGDGREALDLEIIDAAYIGELFKTWGNFKERPDYQELFQDWCMGCNIEALPPPVTKKPDLRVVDSSSEVGEGSENDIRESKAGDEITQVEDDQEVQEAQMPKMLHSNDDENQPSDGEDV